MNDLSLLRAGACASKGAYIPLYVRHYQRGFMIPHMALTNFLGGQAHLGNARVQKRERNKLKLSYC